MEKIRVTTVSDELPKITYLDLKLLKRRVNEVLDFIGDDFVKKSDDKNGEVIFYEEFQKKRDPYGMKNAPIIVREGHKVKERLLNSIFEGLDVSNKIVLDAGCGENTLCELNKSKILFLQDISLNTLIRNKQSHKSAKNRVYVRSSNFEIFKDKSFDLIFAGELIEHLDDPSNFLDECKRILKRRGEIVLTTPNRKALLYRLSLRNFGKEKQHISLMSYNEIKELLNKRFTLKEEVGINQSFFPILQRLNFYLKNKRFVIWWANIFINRPKLATGAIFEYLNK